ncbi:MAG: ribonuclease H-like domain-containing protein [Gammaproteobacteria bacterium]|nr:ribonuclease H-like domain-containing protein [Gammaproteobacteria bacterium]
MKLQDRLHRLRHDAGCAAGPARSVTPGSGAVASAELSVTEALDARLRRTATQRASARPATRGASPAALATALGAIEVSPGLLLKQYTYAFESRAAVDPSALPELAAVPQRDWVYCDTETTGLSGGVGTLAFMVGVARFVAVGRVEVRQYVLCSPAAEAEMLRQVIDWIGADAVLVSYNGKCFDVPLLLSRLALCRVRSALADLPQLDLMYTVRRACRRFWPDCRLQTAERRLLGRVREDDMPGAEAPEAWRRWLRGGDDLGLRGVLRHNALDVESLVALHHRMAQVYAGGDDTGVDYTAIGRAWWQVDLRHEAVRIWEGAGDRLCERGRLLLAAEYRRRGDWPRAVAIWQQLHDAGHAAASVELAKYHEHRRRDYGTALRYASLGDDAGSDQRCVRLRGRLDRGRCATPTGAFQLPLLAGSEANAMK